MKALPMIERLLCTDRNNKAFNTPGLAYVTFSSMQIGYKKYCAETGWLEKHDSIQLCMPAVCLCLLRLLDLKTQSVHLCS